MPGIFRERKQDGSLAFPRLNRLEVRAVSEQGCSDIEQMKDDLLQTVRIRSEDGSVSRMSYLCVTEMLVRNEHFKEELERRVPNVVLV